jgi:hypothetical protein
MAATDPNDSISPPPSLKEEPPSVAQSSTEATHILSWKEALQYTCRKHATLMATPQVVVETIHSLSRSSNIEYRVADLPHDAVDALSESYSRWSEEPATLSLAKREEFVTWIRERIRESIIISEKKENEAISSAVLARPLDQFGQMCASLFRPFWAVLFLLSFLWSRTSASMKMLAQRLMQLYLHQASDYSEAILAPNEPSSLPFCSSSSSSQEWEGMKTPDPVVLSALRSGTKKNTTPNFSSLMSPSRVFANDIMTPNSTNIAWDKPFVSVELILDSLKYIRNQLHLRRQSYLALRDPSVGTIVSVHSVRQWLFPPSNVATDSSSNMEDCNSLQNSRSEQKLNSSPLPTPPAPRNDNGSTTPVAGFLEQIADSQFEWLLSFVTSSTAEMSLTDVDVCVLQRMDRESHAVGGGSVYILQMPSPDAAIDTRLALYDVRQSIATIEASIAQWESTLTAIQKDILVERKTASTANPSAKLLRLLQRYKLYRQHKELGEATLLNLYSVQCSLEHTVQVQQPTVVALQQAKLAMQSLRPKDQNGQDELVEDIRELMEDDPLDLLCKEETHMNSEEMQQLEEELLQLQLQDLPRAPVGFPKANTSATDGNPEVVTNATPYAVDKNASKGDDAVSLEDHCSPLCT